MKNQALKKILNHTCILVVGQVLCVLFIACIKWETLFFIITQIFFFLLSNLLRTLKNYLVLQ